MACERRRLRIGIGAHMNKAAARMFGCWSRTRAVSGHIARGSYVCGVRVRVIVAHVILTGKRCEYYKLIAGARQTLCANARVGKCMLAVLQSTQHNTLHRLFRIVSWDTDFVALFSAQMIGFKCCTLHHYMLHAC